MNKFDNYSLNRQNESSNNPERDEEDDFLTSDSFPDADPQDDEPEEDDLFERLDRMRGITDAQLKEKELEKTGMINVDQEVTKAMQVLSKDDQEAFERTGMIHFDRTAPIEDQVMKAVELQKTKEARQKHIFHVILGLMVAGIIISVLGILANKLINKQKGTASSLSKANPLAVVETESSVKINETSFPNEVFREYVKQNSDTDSDGSLSPDERNAVLVITLKGDPQLLNLKGIELFPLLQAVNVSNTGLTEADFSSNTLITNINVSSTKITSLDLSKNLQLTNLNVSGSTVTSITLPAPSAIEEINTDSTSMTCTRDDSKHFNACSVK